MGSPSQSFITRKNALLFTFSLTFLLLFAVAGAIYAQDNTSRTAPTVVTATKSIDKSSAGVGEIVKYSIRLTNAGGSYSDAIVLTDTLPANITYSGNLDSEETTAITSSGFPTVNGNVISWEGLIGPSGSVDIEFEALIGAGAVIGTNITNTAQISETGGAALTPSVAFAVVTPTLPSKLPNSTKAVDQPEAALNDIIKYTVTLNNDSGSTLYNVWMTDTLPAGLQLVAGSVSVPATAGVIPEPGYPKGTGNVISWNGSIQNGREVPISFSAVLTGSYSIGDVITNTATILEANGAELSISAATTVITESTSAGIYLPIVMKRSPNVPFDVVLNSINQVDARDGIYTVSWAAADLATGYVLEEDDNADFTSPTSVYTGAGTSWTVPSPGKSNGNFYYRVKATNAEGSSQQWSNVEEAQVVTFYTDDTTRTLGSGDECTRLHWDFEGISSIRIVFGIGYDADAVDGVDFRLVCPSRTTTYQAIVKYTDGSEFTYETTVTVNYDNDDDCGRDPIVTKFEPSKNNIDPNELFDMTWDVTCARAIHYRVGSSGSYIPAGGQYTLEDIEIDNDTTIWLRVKRSDDAFVYIQERIYVND